MSKYIVAERGVGVAWQQVRYNNASIKQFDTEEEAFKAAKDYITSINIDNALTAEQKPASAEIYMMDEKGAFMGVLNGKDCYFMDRHKNIVSDKNAFELDGKAEIAVKVVPGT